MPQGLARLKIAEPGPPAWTKTPGAFLNDVDVGPEGVSPRDGTNNLQKVHGFIREITQGGIDY